MANQIINPYTKICPYNDISRRVNTTIIGNIGATLFGKDTVAKKRFYKSAIIRKNKEIIHELVSEIYTFINRLLSEHSNPESYWFRIKFVMQINEKGTILPTPLFDVDLFKHIGQISGKQSDDSIKNISVLLLDIGKTKLSRHIHDTLMLVKREIPIITYSPYNAYHKIPEKIRGIVQNEQSYVVIEDKPYPIKFELVDNILHYYIMDDEHQKSFNDTNDVFGFMLSKLDTGPEISSGGTAFQHLETDVKLLEKSVNTIAIDVDFGRELILELIAELTKHFEEHDEVKEKLLARKRMRKALKERRAKLIRTSIQLESDFDEKKIEYYTAFEMLQVIDKTHADGLLSGDIWTANRFRTVENINGIKEDIIKIHATMTKTTVPESVLLTDAIFKKKSKKIARKK